jgi:hypothetical protein
VNPQKRVILHSERDYDEDGDVMEFRLTYEGELLSASNNKPRASEKHAIRKDFHQQLKQLWEITPHLKEPRHPLPGTMMFVDKDIPVSRQDYLAKKFDRFGFNFVPLVTEDFDLWCAIDILFLRSGPPGKVFESGDLDNRFKTVFDALKMPKHKRRTWRRVQGARAGRRRIALLLLVGR